MATVADLKEETPEEKIQAEKEVTDGEFQHPNVTSSDDISEKIDATVTDSNIITKDTVAEETLHADHVKLPGEPKGEILCKTPELVQDSSEEAGQKETDLQETKIEMPKEKQACTLKDSVDKTYGLPVEAGQKDTSADVPVKIIIESNHDIILASQDIEHVKITASSISSRDCQETEAVTTVESIKEEVQRSNVIEEILPSEDNRLKNGSIIDSELEKEGNVSDSMVNLKTMVTTEQREYKSVVEEDSIVKTDDPSAIQHIERSQDDANKKDERDAYAVETVDEVRKNQIAIPSTPETKDNQVATPSEIIEIKVPQNSKIASNFQASIEDDQQKDQYVNDIKDTAVETGASGEQMLDESYATKDVKVKADAECSNMKESASADKSGSTEAVSDEHFETSITTVSIEKDLTDRGTSYSEDNFPKAVESNQGKTAAGDELKSKEDFDILLVSESAAGEKFQVERTQDLAEVASMKEKEKPEAVAEVSYIVIDEKEKTDEALPSTESTEEKTCQLNETSTLKNVDESSSSEPSVSSNIKKDEKEDDIHKEELVEDRNIHANLYRDDHEDEKLDRTLDTCETVGDDAGAMHPENTHGEIKNDQFKAVESETNDTNKDKAKAEEAEAAYTESENAPSQKVSSSSINDHHEAMIQDNNIRIPGEDQIFSSHKLDEEIVDAKDSQDQEISREDCEKEYQNLNRKITESQHADAELVTQDSADKICNNSHETQLENLDKVPETRSKIQSHEKTCISSVEDGENTFIPSVSGILKNDMQSNIVEEIVILRNERESLNQETLAGERDTYSLPREDENEKGQTGASFYETFVEKENNSSEACEEEGTMKNTEDSVHGNQDLREKDLIEEEATYARSDELEDEINAGPSCTSKPFTETIDPEKEVKAIHASNEKILDKTVATVVLTSKPLDGTLKEEKELETMHAGSEQLPDESVASSFINEESQKEIMEGDKDHLIHSDQSSKTENILEEIEDGRHFKDDQISITEHLVKEVYPTNVEAESQEADIKSPGIDESAEELSNTQEVVPSSDLKLASETIESNDSNQSSKDIGPIEPEDGENTCALQSESTVPSCDFLREKTYQSNESPVDMTLDPTGEIEIAERSAEEELPHKECRATTTSDTDIEWKNQTESLTCELDTSSLEKKNDDEERKTDMELKGTCDDVHNVDRGPCAEEVHITNTEEIILDGDTGLESVEEVDECIHGDQDNKLKDLTEEEATYASGDKLEDDIDASPSCTSKPLTETIDPEKDVEAIHASSEIFLDKTVATVVLTSKLLDGTLEEEKEVETMHAGSEQLSDESVASSIINDESQKEIVEGDKDHMVHSDQSSKTDKVLEDDRHFNDDQISVTGNLVKEVHPTNVEAEIQEADIKSPGIDESSEELSSNTQEVVPSSDLQLASEKTNFEQSSKGIAPIETKDEANTFASDFSREQTYESNKSPVDMTLDPTGEIEIAEAELLNKECRAITTSDTDIVTTDHTESLTCEVETSSLEKKDGHEERKTGIEHKGTSDEAHNVDGGPWVEEVHITNTDEIIQDGDMRLESVKEVDECFHGDQDNKLKDLTEEEEATYTSGDKLEDDIDASPSFTSKPLTETIDPEKEVEVIPESQEADIRSPGIEESTEELSNNTQEVVHSSDLKLASETTNSDQSSKDIAPIEAEDEEHTFALQSESTAPSSDFSREQTYQSNKAPVDMMLNKQCHATTTLDSDIETKDQTESLTCEVETSSFEKKDDHEEREIDIQLKGTCDDVQNVAGGPCEEEIHINNTKEIILDGDTGLESVKQVDVKCTHGDQDMVKDDLKEVEESDRGSIEKSMYEEAFMEDNAFYFSPEKHEEDQFTSAHKAQDEARKKELADYSSKQENIVDEKVHDKGVESENDPNSRTSTDNEEASRSITYGEKEGDTEKQIESLNPKPGDLPVVQTLFMKSLDFDDQKNDEGVEDPKTSRVEEVLNIGDHSTVEDPKEDLENKNVQEILHERDEKETVQTSLDFLVEKEGKNLLGVKVPMKGDMEQPTSMESREPAERVGTGTITKEEFTEFFAVEGMSEIKGHCPQAMEKDSLNEIDTTKMEGLKVQEFGIAREHSRIESEKVELRKENGNNGNGVGNDDNSKMQEEPEEGKPTDEKIDKKVDEKMQNQTERDAQSAGMLHADIVEEYSVIDDLNSSEQNVNSVDSVKCKEETKDVEEQHKNMVAVPAFLLSATKETFEEKEKPEAAFCAATPSTEGEIIEKEKREAEVATTELFNTIPTTNNGTSNEKGQRMNVFEGEEKKNSDDSTIAKDMIFEEGGCDLKKSLFMDRNEADNDKGDMVEIKMTHEQDLAPLVTAQCNSEVLDCNKLNTAEEKDEGTSKNLSSLSTTEPIEGTICKDRGQDVPEDTSLVHNDKADPSKFMKEDESTVLMASQPIITEGLLPAEEKVPTPKEEDACTVDNYLPVSQFLLNLIHEEFPDDENTKADNLKQEGIVPKDYIKTETRTEEDNRDSMELPANNSSLMLEEKKHDFCERPEDGNAEGMEELTKLSNSPNEREIDKDTNDDNFFLSESAESRHGDLKILNDEAKEELTIVSKSGIEEDVSSTHPSYDKKVYEQKTHKEHAIESCLDKNIDVQEVDSKDEEILKQESNDSEDKIESQLDNEMINEAGLENKASVVIQPEEIKELEDSINNKGTLPNTQGVEQTKVSHSEIYVDDLQLRSTDTVEKIKEEVAEDQTTKMETLSPDDKEPYKNLDAVEQKNPSENFIIFVDPKEVQSNVETVDKAMEDQKAFSAIKSAEVKCAESLVAREIEEVLPEVKTLPVTELAEATDPECIPTGKIVERDTDKKSTATTDEECLTTSEIVEKVKEEDETSTTVKSGVKDAEHFNGSEETAQSNQFQVAEVLGYIVVQGQKQGEIFENESEFVEETEKEEKAQMNINIKESSSGDLKESYLSMENQTDIQKRAAEDKNQNAESYLERKEIKDSTVKEEKIEEAKNESSGQNVTEESGHETAPLIEMKEGKHSPSNKKHGNILSGVRSKVKHSISSVKKAITCSSSVSHLIHEGN